MTNEFEINRWFTMKPLKMLVEVENSKTDIDYRQYISKILWLIETKKKDKVLLKLPNTNYVLNPKF
jgi:hypothetical protein